MFKKVPYLIFLLWILGAHSQNSNVPVDLRQHNLTEYNSSFFNPVLSSYGKNRQSVALWTRWQWQQIDTDPSTLFFNYTRQLNNDSSAGLGFFQHNTGVFVNTGAVMNYAYMYTIGPDLKIGIGLNLFAFKQLSADTRFAIDPQISLSQLRESNDFVLQVAPGLQLKWKDLGIGLTSENLFDYNFTLKERQSRSNDRIYLLSAAYDFYLFSNSNVLRPTVYWKSLPFQDDQIGVSALFSTAKYWAQAGYNDFYGISIGAGGRFFKKIALGALVEFATTSGLDEKKPTFEIIAAYNLGNSTKSVERVRKQESIFTKKRKRPSKKGRKIKKDRSDGVTASKRRQRADSLNQIRKTKAEESFSEQPVDSLKLIPTESKQELEMRQAREKALKNQRNTDSITRITAEKLMDDPANKVDKTPERYEEVASEEGLSPGFYLIANVFSSKENNKLFIQSLTKKGLMPKSFLRNSNKYHYVYLERYDTLKKAREARKSNFFGKYSDNVWIFRVVGE